MYLNVYCILITDASQGIPSRIEYVTYHSAIDQGPGFGEEGSIFIINVATDKLSFLGRIICLFWAAF